MASKPSYDVETELAKLLVDFIVPPVKKARADMLVHTSLRYKISSLPKNKFGKLLEQTPHIV